MKIQLALVLCASLLPMACGQITEENIQSAKDALSSMTSDEQAANDLYLDDVVDSAGDETAPEGSTPESEGEVKDDMKAERLKQMATMMFTRLDADKSGNLSLEEFLVGPEKRAEEKEVNEEHAAKIKARLTADFEKFAGADKLLTQEELQTLLKESAPRVGHHRHKHFPGKHEERVVKTSDELIKEFDKDADGKLDAAELEALRNAKKSEMDDFRAKKGPHSPKGKGGEHPRGEPGDDKGGRGEGEDKGKDGDDTTAPVPPAPPAV